MKTRSLVDFILRTRAHLVKFNQLLQKEGERQIFFWPDVGSNNNLSWVVFPGMNIRIAWLKNKIFDSGNLINWKNFQDNPWFSPLSRHCRLSAEFTISSSISMWSDLETQKITQKNAMQKIQTHRMSNQIVFPEKSKSTSHIHYVSGKSLLDLSFVPLSSFFLLEIETGIKLNFEAISDKLDLLLWWLWDIESIKLFVIA